MVIIPAKRFGIFNKVCKRAVKIPAVIPAIIATTKPRYKSEPLVINIAATHAPVAKEPSTVISGKSRILKVIKTPRTIIA